MRISLIFSLFVSFFILQACTSAKNQFEKGNYEKAVLLSIKKLRKKPNNSKQQNILKAAYGYAIPVSEQKINQYTASQDLFKWDPVIAQYQSMQKIYLELLQCPSCLKVVTAVDYQEPLNQALEKGAQVYLEEGIKAISSQNKEAARQAFRYFNQAKNYRAGLPEINALINTAKEMGTERIAISKIPVNSKGLELNSQFFLQQLTQKLNQLNYRFAEFYPIDNNTTEADHIIDLSFDDYFIGQTYLKETRETVVKDSVKVGKVKDSLGNENVVFGKVSADIRYFEKTIESGGLLNLAVIDPKKQAVVFQEKIPSTYVWKNNWLLYQGDKRALTKEDLRLSKQKELIPPPPQELFYAFTQPLFDQTARRIRQQYRYLKQ